jgi:hypothetical protein
LSAKGVVPWIGGGRGETSEGKREEAKRRNMVAAGGSFVAHDLEVYVIEENRTCFNGIWALEK